MRKVEWRTRAERVIAENDGNLAVSYMPWFSQRQAMQYAAQLNKYSENLTATVERRAVIYTEWEEV